MESRSRDGLAAKGLFVTNSVRLQWEQVCNSEQKIEEGIERLNYP